MDPHVQLPAETLLAGARHLPTRSAISGKPGASCPPSEHLGRKFLGNLPSKIELLTSYSEQLACIGPGGKQRSRRNMLSVLSRRGSGGACAPTDRIEVRCMSATFAPDRQRGQFN
eukprot:2996178-Amphidinium_carterae.3